MKKGKHPTVTRSKTVRRNAATSTLKAMMDRLVRTPTKKRIKTEP